MDHKNVIIISIKGVLSPKLRSLFYGYTERFAPRFSSGFFILLDLNIFSASLAQQIEDPLFLSLSLPLVTLILGQLFSNI